MRVRLESEIEQGWSQKARVRIRIILGSETGDQETRRSLELQWTKFCVVAYIISWGNPQCLASQGASEYCHSGSLGWQFLWHLLSTVLSGCRSAWHPGSTVGPSAVPGSADAPSSPKTLTYKSISALLLGGAWDALYAGLVDKSHYTGSQCETYSQLKVCGKISLGDMYYMSK